MKAIALELDHLRQAWWRLQPFAEQLAERYPDDWPPGEIQRAAIAGGILVWILWDPEANEALGMLGTTVAVKASGRRVCRVRFAAGHDFRRWIGVAREAVEAFAAHNGCSRVEICQPRDGWARALPDYTASHQLALTKEI